MYIDISEIFCIIYILIYIINIIILYIYIIYTYKKNYFYLGDNPNVFLKLVCGCFHNT